MIYDRIFESDVKVTATTKIAEMYIRKQNIFTEKKVFKYATINELESAAIEKCRQLAVLKAKICSCSLRRSIFLISSLWKESKL